MRRVNLRREPAPYAPTVLANLVRPLLLDVARLLERAPERLIVSGLLREEADEVVAAFEDHGLAEKDRRFGGEWAAVSAGVRALEPGGDEAVGGARVRLDHGAGASGTTSAAAAGPPRRRGRRSPSLPSQIRSSGKRIVNVCTERQRGMCSASCSGISSSRARPFMRAARLSASATRRPPPRSRPGSGSSRGQGARDSADAELAAATAAAPPPPPPPPPPPLGAGEAGGV